MASVRLLVLVPLAFLVATASAELLKRPYAPLLAADAPTRIQGEYAVVLKKTATDQEVADHKQTVRQLMSYYNYNLAKNESYIMGRHQWTIGTFKGYGAVMTDKVRDLVRSMSIVDYVECNQVYTTQQASCDNQENAPWGLVRTTNRNLNPDDKDYSRNPTNGDGSGVDVYIIDTGIYTGHPDFEGRAIWGADFVDDPSPRTDLNGHGTHVAGTVMADKYGLARRATAIAVRVLDQNGSGTTIGVIAGIDWAAAEHTSRGKKSIANMSLGGGKSTSLNNAVNNAVDAGVTMVVAAGNEAQDACNVSPASASKAFAVAASDDGDDFAYFSNYGDECVKIIAPGVAIKSTWLNGGTNTISGTSMAAPHVAGVMAKYLSEAGTSYTPTTLAEKTVQEGTENKVQGNKGTPNILVFKSCITE